jgi:hypothetical protein
MPSKKVGFCQGVKDRTAGCRSLGRNKQALEPEPWSVARSGVGLVSLSQQPRIALVASSSSTALLALPADEKAFRS